MCYKLDTVWNAEIIRGSEKLNRETARARSALAGAEGLEPSARGFGAMPDVFQDVSARSNWCRNVSACQAINGCV